MEIVSKWFKMVLDDWKNKKNHLKIISKKNNKIILGGHPTSPLECTRQALNHLEVVAQIK